MATGDSYYGISLFPFNMIYHYEHDVEEYFVPAKEEPMEFNELVKFLKQIKVSEIKKINELIEFISLIEDSE
ncbi:hypothetical protein ACFP65_09615 [Marinilactibacillus sp. GCM10026970]|uniref:hypothetical protein n=1 Tax=Marinilactibacillus sp. GCM10026970 TaxID=3252642 RepID=UPI00360FFC86